MAGRTPASSSRAAIRAALVAEVDGDAEVAESGPPPRGSRLVVAAAAIVAVAALVGGLLYLAGRPGDGENSDRQVAPSVTEQREPTAAQILDRMPATPLDGKQSWKLPVLAVPQSDIRSRQVVTVLGRGFKPGERVGIVMCAAESAIEGAAACDLGEGYANVTYVNAGRDGSVSSEFEVRRRISTPATGRVDCRSAAERCLVAIGAISNYDRSGGSFLRFAGAPPFPTPFVTVDPVGPYVPGQAISVQATGLIAPREMQVLQCRDERCAVLLRGNVAPDGTFGGTVEVEPTFVDRAGKHVACEGACVLRVDGIGLEGASSAPGAPTQRITFALADPSEGTVAPTVPETLVPPPATTVFAPRATTAPPPATTVFAPTATTAPGDS